MSAAPFWSPSARIAKFREKVATLQANPLVQEVTHVRTQAVRLADGTFQVEGTRADPDRLRLLMLDARVFEQRNDSGGVALETINNVVVQELKRLGFNHLAKEWGVLRKAQREERNRWYKPSGKRIKMISIQPTWWNLSITATLTTWITRRWNSTRKSAAQTIF